MHFLLLNADYVVIIITKKLLPLLYADRCELL